MTPNATPSPIRIPAIGRIVHYVLNETDALTINKQRKLTAFHPGKDPMWMSPAPVLEGNSVEAGQTYPAMIIRVWSDDPKPESCCNLQVFLDGNDTYWATSRVAYPQPTIGGFTWPTK